MPRIISQRCRDLLHISYHDIYESRTTRRQPPHPTPYFCELCGFHRTPCGSKLADLWRNPTFSRPAQATAHGTVGPAHLQSFVPQIPCDGEKLRVIPRYTRPDMGRIWSDENRFRSWLAVEVAATETLAEAGLVPREAARAIRERADFKVERIHEIEAEVRHDVIAFTTAVAEIVGPDARWFHYGLTSNDVVDTAQALLIGQASNIIAEDLQRLAEVLERRAWEYKDTPQIGRT